jgi:hypothetical protein
MKIKITCKYEVVNGEEIIECETLEQAEKKLKSLRGSELECYMVRKEFQGKKLLEEFYVG